MSLYKKFIGTFASGMSVHTARTIRTVRWRISGEKGLLYGHPDDFSLRAFRLLEHRDGSIEKKSRPWGLDFVSSLRWSADFSC